MSEKELYGMLKEMVGLLEKKDFKGISKLNKSFELVYKKVFPPPNKEELPLEYDNCRQSCIAPISLSEVYEIALADAKERLSRIPEPED